MLQPNELPTAGTVFKEGYLVKRAVKSGRNWKRRFFILEGTLLSYYESFQSAMKGHIKLKPGSIAVSTNEFPGHEYCISLTVPNNLPLFLETEGESEMYEWLEMLNYAILSTDKKKVHPPPVITRFIEGPLYKTCRNAKQWHTRWFDMNGPELSYRQSNGKPRKAIFDIRQCEIIPNQTDAKGGPTPFVFKLICSVDDRVLNLAAPNEGEYLKWLKNFHLTLQSSQDVLRRKARTLHPNASFSLNETKTEMDAPNEFVEPDDLEDLSL